MTTTPAQSTPQIATSRSRSGRRFLLFTSLLAVVIFGSLVFQQRSMEAAVRKRVLVNDASAEPPRPLVDVATAVKALKLVTVEIETEVTATMEDESWRGDISAKVTAPARLSYGTDLSQLDVQAVGFSPVTRSYVLRIPRPMRVATEVWSDRERLEVSTGWLRLRSRAGEFYLGLARKNLAERARAMELREEDAEKVARVTLEQVEMLAKKLIGDDAKVIVEYAEPRSAAGGVP